MVESGFKTKAQELIKLMVDTIADKEYAKRHSEQLFQKFVGFDVWRNSLFGFS